MSLALGKVQTNLCQLRFTCMQHQLKPCTCPRYWSSLFDKILIITTDLYTSHSLNDLIDMIDVCEQSPMDERALAITG